jgi:hypothetical protein
MAATPQGKRRHANAQQNATVPLRGADRADIRDGASQVRRFFHDDAPSHTRQCGVAPELGDRIRHDFLSVTAPAMLFTAVRTHDWLQDALRGNRRPRDPIDRNHFHLSVAPLHRGGPKSVVERNESSDHPTSHVQNLFVYTDKWPIGDGPPFGVG